ncbi:MAG: HAMP domain-containing histidine kinase, partial [Oscillospiraceae bacterium]|nr:HAMP domain-containing histidine kinase [Oscillospiraceae bacterium]
MRNAFAYICITLLVLLFLNIYSASKTRELMFQAKSESVQDKLELVVSSFGGVDVISHESTSQIISVLGDLNVTRLLVTDGEACAVYDSSVGQNAQGRYVLLEEVVQALGGSDVFRCSYGNGILESYAAMPVMVRGESVGCVYMMEYDAEQGEVIANLERNILVSSLLLLGAIVIASVIFSTTGSRRMRKILASIRMAREGEYSQKIRIRGSDEMGKLANEFNKLTERLQESETMQRQFISDASHELKTPLSSIKLLSDSILQNEMDENTMREFVADIGRESDRLTRLAQDILTLDRSERESDIEHEVVCADEVVSRVFRMLIPLASEKGIDLTGSFETDCTVLTAEDDLYQILFNLVEN